MLDPRYYRLYSVSVSSPLAFSIPPSLSFFPSFAGSSPVCGSAWLSVCYYHPSLSLVHDFSHDQVKCLRKTWVASPLRGEELDSHSTVICLTLCHTPTECVGYHNITTTETKMSSFWRNFNHWLHWKLSFWQLPVQPVMKISSKWRHFRFSDCASIVHILSWLMGHLHYNLAIIFATVWFMSITIIKPTAIIICFSLLYDTVTMNAYLSVHYYAERKYNFDDISLVSSEDVETTTFNAACDENVIKTTFPC